MSFSIARFARGLPALLAISEGGAGPRFLADTVAPVIDLSDLYLIDGRQTIGFNQVAGVAVGRNDFPAPATGFADGVVPPGELWYVWQFGLQAAPGAGAAIEFAPGVFLDGQSVIGFACGPYAAGGAVSDVRNTCPAPFWAGPGSRLFALVKSVTGAVTVSGAAVVTRLRI